MNDLRPHRDPRITEETVLLSQDRRRRNFATLEDAPPSREEDDSGMTGGINVCPNCGKYVDGRSLGDHYDYRDNRYACGVALKLDQKTFDIGLDQIDAKLIIHGLRRNNSSRRASVLCAELTKKYIEVFGETP